MFAGYLLYYPQHSYRGSSVVKSSPNSNYAFGDNQKGGSKSRHHHPELRYVVVSDGSISLYSCREERRRQLLEEYPLTKHKIKLTLLVSGNSKKDGQEKYNNDSSSSPTQLHKFRISTQRVIEVLPPLPGTESYSIKMESRTKDIVFAASTYALSKFWCEKVATWKRSMGWKDEIEELAAFCNEDVYLISRLAMMIESRERRYSSSQQRGAGRHEERRQSIPGYSTAHRGIQQHERARAATLSQANPELVKQNSGESTDSASSYSSCRSADETGNSGLTSVASFSSQGSSSAAVANNSSSIPLANLADKITYKNYTKSHDFTHNKNSQNKPSPTDVNGSHHKKNSASSPSPAAVSGSAAYPVTAAKITTFASFVSSNTHYRTTVPVAV